MADRVVDLEATVADRVVDLEATAEEVSFRFGAHFNRSG